MKRLAFFLPSLHLSFDLLMESRSKVQCENAKCYYQAWAGQRRHLMMDECGI